MGVMRSIAGYPKHYDSPTRYDVRDLMMEDRDLVLEDGDLVMVEGAAGLGQSIALSLSAYFADLSDPQGFEERVRLQGAPRPEFSSGRRRALTAQTLWEMENAPETRTTDSRGMALPERIDAAISEASAYLAAVFDVRTDGHDVEIDYHAFGYEPHVLRLDGLVPRPGSTSGWKRAFPIRRESLLEVEDLQHRLVAYAKENPEFVRQLHWRTFERLVAELLEAAGWEVLELTRGSKDRGVDIYAALPGTGGSTIAVIDCKKYCDKIGVETVRSVAGLKLQHNAAVGMLVTTSYYTSGARDLERNELSAHVQLHDFDQVKEWLAAHQWTNVSGLYLPNSRFSKDSTG